MSTIEKKAIKNVENKLIMSKWQNMAYKFQVREI